MGNRRYQIGISRKIHHRRCSKLAPCQPEHSNFLSSTSLDRFHFLDHLLSILAAGLTHDCILSAHPSRQCFFQLSSQSQGADLVPLVIARHISLTGQTRLLQSCESSVQSRHVVSHETCGATFFAQRGSGCGGKMRWCDRRGQSGRYAKGGKASAATGMLLGRVSCRGQTSVIWLNLNWRVTRVSGCGCAGWLSGCHCDWIFGLTEGLSKLRL